MSNATIFSEYTITMFEISYGFLFCVGFLANSVTGVQMLSRRMSLPFHVYTLHLCVCDIIILCLYVPTQILFIKEQLEWHMGSLVCQLVNIILPTALNGTIGTLLAINVDIVLDLMRHRDISSPRWPEVSSFLRYLLAPTTSKRKLIRAHVTMLIIWVVSLIISYPLIGNSHVTTYNGILYCDEGWSDIGTYERYWVGVFVVLFCLPLLILLTSYSILLHYMGKINKKSEFNKYKKTVNTGILLALVFAVCTVFQHIFFFATASFGMDMDDERKAMFYASSNFLVILQAALNPFSYGKFRNMIAERHRSVRASIRRIRSANGTEMVYITNKKKKKRLQPRLMQQYE